MQTYQWDASIDATSQAFCSEALVWQQLQHKNILPFLGVDLMTFRSLHCMVSPWMEKGNIMQCIASLREQKVNIPFNRWVRRYSFCVLYMNQRSYPVTVLLQDTPNRGRSQLFT